MFEGIDLGAGHSGLDNHRVHGVGVLASINLGCGYVRMITSQRHPIQTMLGCSTA